MNFPNPENPERICKISLEEPPEIDLSSLLDAEGQNLAFVDGPENQTEEGEKYLVFQIDEKLYGVGSCHISEVTNPIPVTPLPNVPDWLIGISNLRGDIIPVVSLRRFWKRQDSISDKAKLMVFRSEEFDSTVAFAVDKLHEMITLRQKDISFTAADYVDAFPMFFGKTDINSQTIYLLDADSLLSSVMLDHKPA